MTITADDIINGVNRRISNPTPQGLMDNSDILAFCDNIVQSEIIPLIESTSQDFFVERIEIPIQGGVSAYSVPYRSIARGLREIKLRDSTGNTYRNLPLVSIENSYEYFSWDQVVGFHFEGDSIRLVPDVPASISGSPVMVLWYRLPPNKLVERSYVGQVTNILGDTVTVDTIPTGWVAGTQLDFCQGKSGSAIYAYDVPIDSLGGSPGEIIFGTGAVPSNLSVGDYLSLSGQSYVLNWVPNEGYPLVETLTCRRLLQATSDYEGMKMLDPDAERERTNLKMILEPRIDGESTIIVNYWSLARGFKNNQRSWLYGQ